MLKSSEGGEEVDGEEEGEEVGEKGECVLCKRENG